MPASRVPPRCSNTGRPKVAACRYRRIAASLQVACKALEQRPEGPLMVPQFTNTRRRRAQRREHVDLHVELSGPVTSCRVQRPQRTGLPEESPAELVVPMSRTQHYGRPRTKPPVQAMGRDLQQRRHPDLGAAGPPPGPRRDRRHRGQELSRSVPHQRLMPVGAGLAGDTLRPW